MSKATPRGAVAKFAYSGKPGKRKDLGRLAMSYGNVYVAQIAMGSSDAQTVKAIIEAEAYDGPSIIIAYSHCIPGHGIGPGVGLDQQKGAVNSGMWPLFRFHPENIDKGENPLSMDSREPTMDIADYMYKEIRFKALTMSKPEEADKMLGNLRKHVKRQYETYKAMAERSFE